MPAAMKIIPGLSMTAAPNLPRITQTDEDKRIARLPGLIHLFEPDRLAIPSGGTALAAKDRATPGHAIATTSPSITVATNAGYNNKKVVMKTAGQAAFAYAAGTAPKSFTLIIAADLSQARITAALGAALFGVFNGTTVKYSLNYRADLGRLQFLENYAVGGAANLVPLVNMPAGDQKFVLVLSYDAETRTSRISLNSTDILSSLTHATTAPVIDTDSRVAIGGHMQGGTLNWDGHAGRAILLDRNYHDAAYLPLLAREIAEMRAYYGI